MTGTDTDKPLNRTGRYAPFWRRAAFRLFANHSFVRRGRTRHGSFDTYVSAGAQLSVLDPRGVPIDPVHTRFVDRWVREDSIVWDVGGNMGLFAFPAALKARKGHVYAFEPDVELASNLIRSVRRPHNAGLHMTIVPFALSNVEAPATFLIAAYGRSMNKLDGVGSWHDDLFVPSEKRVVATVRMDKAAELLPPPSIMKIDVEGAELLVLEGGRKTIEANRPVLLIEGPKQLADDMVAYFRDLDYVFMDGFAENPVPLDTTAWDTVAVPGERWREIAKTARS